MALTPGTRLDVYEVTTPLGVGGMGEVYRATDTKLKRQVAIKILPPSLAVDSDRLARFQREAEVLASLNHPNIAAIYGLEEADGVKALVMELVEGEDLALRIARGAIPLAEALLIAKQIAEALEAAHEQGIIHRDLKPANVKVREDGTVKVLDFGLAKAMDAPTPAPKPNMSQSPTITSPAMMTGVGVLLGTAAYMSPEQARGKTVDRRADIWAFGCVLFEMLTGKRAFAGDDVSDVLASVLAREPDWAQLPAALSPTLANVVRRCLHKDARHRIHDIADVRLALEGAFETTAAPTATRATSSSKGARFTWVVAVVVAALVIPSVWYVRQTPPQVPAEMRTEIVTPFTDDPTSFALSPDGRQIVFAASDDGTPRLWLRSLASTTAQLLPGTEGARSPFWAPDNRSIGFFAAGVLKRLDLGGGAPQTLATVINSRGATWNTNDVIVFSSTLLTPLRRISATVGRPPTAVTTLGPRQIFHGSPTFLPDGRRFLFYIRGQDAGGIYLGTLDGSAPTRLTEAGSAGVYLPAGWLLWVREGRLVAQRFDLALAALTGEQVLLADGVVADDGAMIPVSVAATGLVAYRAGGSTQRQLTWVDRSGTAQSTVGDPDATLNDPRVSPDGRVAVSRTVLGNGDVFVIDGDRTSRITDNDAEDRAPIWSPDGTRIAFTSTRTGGGDLYQWLTNDVEEMIMASDQRKTALGWSADGQFLLYHTNDEGNETSNLDLWVMPMKRDRAPWAFLKTPFREGNGVFSPDGRWVAYMSNESTRMEIYVRPFAPPGGAVPAAGAAGAKMVSTAGGIYPAWRPDGKELYYLNPAGEMMAVPMALTGSTLTPGAPVKLFPTRIVGGGIDAAQRRQYDVAPDGRFLINTALDVGGAPITLLQNWNPEAKR